MERNRKKQNIIIIICILTGVCLTGGIVAAGTVLQQKNPLAAGLANLAKEVMAQEAELGENFWTDAVNQIGSENVQAEYSLNIGGIPELQNITVGLDGKTRRDMEQQLFENDFRISVTNAELAGVSISGTPETVFVQIPSIWEGSVVFEAENVNGQWNNSFARKQIQSLTGQELEIERRIDAKVLDQFSIKSFSAAAFLRENAEILKILYENMKVIKIGKAQKEGMLSKEQAENLESYALLDAEGSQIETVCYLVILPKQEFGEIFQNVTDDIRLAVYLDQERRIVRISTLLDEVLVTDTGEKRIGLNLTGAEDTIDRLEITISNVADTGKIVSEQWKEGTDKIEIDSSFTIEKETSRMGSYDIEGNIVLTNQNNIWELSAEGNIQGERTESGEKLSVNLKNMTWGSEEEVLCRFSGKAAFEPLAEKILLPSGKEYRVDEMNEMETAVFLAECVENVYRNYSGYLKMLQ